LRSTRKTAPRHVIRRERHGRPEEGRRPGHGSIKGEIGLHATPVVAKNTVIVGAAHLPGGAPKSRQNEKGYIRASTSKTGKRMWIFHTIPQLGEFGNDTWEKESWVYTGTPACGADFRRRGTEHRLLPSSCRPAISNGGHRPARTCSARLLWPST